MRHSLWITIVFASALLTSAPGRPASAKPPVDKVDASIVQGMTISCQTWGWEWGSPGFAEELGELEQLGVNWVAIHPYARIRANGSVEWREFDPKNPPQHLAGPIREAHARGLSILIKPHIAYWGSGFSWRGAIRFEQLEARERFHATYQTWISSLAEATRDADAFCIGTELEGLVEDATPWRKLIAEVRTKTPAHLTYAANWSEYQLVQFWDALDVIGLQAYFPISEAESPNEDELRGGWKRVLEELRELHGTWGKPLVFTELGYNHSLQAAARPWEYRGASREEHERAVELQTRCTRVALEVLGKEHEWLRGVFLWKWFVGESRGENFLVDTPELRGVLQEVWASK